MGRILSLIIVGVFAMSQLAFAQVDNSQARKILNQVAEKAKSYENLKFEFTYRLLDDAHNIDELVKGTLVMQGDMYNLNVLGRNIVSDSKTQWTVDPDAEEVQISNTDESNDMFGPLKLITSIDDTYNPTLIKTIKENGVEYYIIDLTPKQTKSYYKVRLKINKAKSWVEEATVYGKDNVKYIYTIVKLVTNLDLPADYFRIDPAKYPDFDVVDLR